MATRLYWQNVTAPYSPATFHGSWTVTTGAADKMLAPTKTGGGTYAEVSGASNGTNPNSRCLFRLVSPPLAAQTISGTVLGCANPREDDYTMQGYWRVHIWVTQGDSDTERGVLLNQYAEDTTNEWSNSAFHVGNEWQAAQSLSSVACSAGDRIVAEVGFIARSTVVNDGRLRVGTEFTTGYSATPAYDVYQDSLEGLDFFYNPQAPWLEFSGTITFQSKESRVTQATVLAANAPAPELRVTHLYVLTASPYEPEVAPEPGESFGPLLWAEYDWPGGGRKYWAVVDLPDPATYYGGYKEPRLLSAGPFVRGLSDDEGEYEAARFPVELSDTDRLLRSQLAQAGGARLLLNELLVVRMISDPDRRALKRPRTVAVGKVRNYRLD